MKRNWTTNKDDVIVLSQNNKLIAGTWRQAVDTDTIGLIAVIYGDYPNIWLHRKMFLGEGQVKIAKKWIESLISIT